MDKELTAFGIGIGLGCLLGIGLAAAPFATLVLAAIIVALVMWW